MYQLPPINTILVNYNQIVFAFAYAAPKAKAAAMLDDHGDCLQQQTQSSSSSSSSFPAIIIVQDWRCNTHVCSVQDWKPPRPLSLIN